MSFSRSVQPVQRVNVNGSQGQGRGRGRALQTTKPSMNYAGQRRSYDTGMRQGDNGQYQDDRMPEEEGEGTVSQNQNEQERRLEYRGCYSVMRPDEKKRTKINQQAEAESRQYEAYKQANKLTYVSYTGTVGGGPVQSNAPARSRLVTNQPTRYEKLEKRNQYRQEAKDRENEEIRIMRENARKQSERNAQRNVTDHAQRDARHRADRQRTNEAFLDRLEGKR